jgi:hypothetical protein
MRTAVNPVVYGRFLCWLGFGAAFLLVSAIAIGGEGLVAPWL